MAETIHCVNCGTPLDGDTTTCPACGKNPRAPKGPQVSVTDGFTPAQQQLFDAEFDAVKKDGGTGALLAFLLGGIGAHHFYLGWWVAGALYLVFCWTFVPMVLGVIEAFLMGGRVQRYNDQRAKLIAARIRVAAEAAAR